MRVAGLVVRAIAEAESSVPAMALQSAAVPLSPSLMQNPSLAAHAAIQSVADALDPGRGVIKDTITNIGDVANAAHDLIHFGTGSDQHFAIVTEVPALLTDGLALADAVVTGDRLHIAVSSLNLGADAAVEVVGQFVSQDAHGQMFASATRILVSILKIAAPLIAAYKREQDKADSLVPTLSEQVMRSYTTRLTGGDDMTKQFTFIPNVPDLSNANYTQASSLGQWRQRLPNVKLIELEHDRPSS